ncbi:MULTISPECIES: hypothetical protein [Planktothrix]|jgi:hypothetical protein|uniref:Uncharacterized protein n=3 Tax=Planktothrix TaxID=54304 RepID=A0A1J1JD91_PLAAG|nr:MULTISPECIES: hypothetical protein [Planktothrix]CAD5947116.1 hypothetical protein NO108_02678 [Planktothrix rubescens]MBG0746027.1 hypothetical protein [Planktothrix agardhii KL2]MCF3581357.1 hypothetical protein [Planktothrix agardhii 1811]MCF3626034.1 hypothetical protein [Planktothrix agardhii 1801]CAC5344585.1 conserved hypothetical protein [Planktothrix rubescens NIVA-CYA 18]
MEELQYLATWVKEQHAQEYILTWLLTQPGLWWSNGEVYQAVLQKSGKRLKEFVKKSKQGDLFQGIADKIVSDESWDQIAESLARLMGIYQEELVKLQDQGRLEQTTRLSVQRPSPQSKSWSNLDVQQPLPDPNTDALTGL